VARGRPTGEKVETTIAFTPRALSAQQSGRFELLGEAWLAKWRRSTAQFPAWLAPEHRPEFEKKISSLPQFLKPGV